MVMNEGIVDEEVVTSLRNQSETTPDLLWDKLRKFRQATQIGISELSVSTDQHANRKLLDDLLDFSREMGAIRLSAVLEEIISQIRPGHLPHADQLSRLYETYARTYARLVLLIFSKD